MTNNLHVTCIIVTVLTALLLQAVFPRRRVSIVLIGATVCSAVAVVSGSSTMSVLYNAVPFNVIMILIGLGLFTSLMSRSNIFSLIAIKIVDLTQGYPLRVFVIFSFAMFVVSAFLNNITAICIMLPIMLVVISSLGVTQKYLSLFLSLIITATNLGGAASPIGDFPAILLFSDKDVNLTFLQYLYHAGAICLIALVVNVVVFYFLFFNRCKLTTTTASRILSIQTSHLLYRNVKANYNILIPGCCIFMVMLYLWAFPPEELHLTPDIVCLGGVSTFMAYLLIFVKMQERNSENYHLVEYVLRKETDIESILFLGSLFFMVAAVGTTGTLGHVGSKILALRDISPLFTIVVFLFVTGLLTAIFSAGPSMGAMLPIAKQIVTLGDFPEHIIYIGLALSVCAGSSFFLTAATSGPILQAIVGRSGLKTTDGDAVFGFWNFLPYGIVSFVVIESITLIWVMTSITWRF